MTVNHQKSRNFASVTASAALTVALAAFMAVGLWLYAPHAEAQRTGPFMLVAHSNETANVGIFRIDTASGGVSFCVPDAGGAAVRCSPEAE